uniref:B box-type domain-containing protein n=1 Tax=Kalanchoe fedtschenkoi TaxID=63787 RepID=A0A7N0ZUM7_KALFE
MCRGEEEVKRVIDSGSSGGRSADDVGHHPSRDLVRCELCNSRASLYCQADDAYLCRKCDKSVHGANFLARRHIRCMLCNTCQNLTRRYLVGAHREMLLPSPIFCPSGRVRRHHGDHCLPNDDPACPTSSAPNKTFMFL